MNLQCKTQSVWYIVNDMYQLSLLEVILLAANHIYTTPGLLFAFLFLINSPPVFYGLLIPRSRDLNIVITLFTTSFPQSSQLTDSPANLPTFSSKCHFSPFLSSSPLCHPPNWPPSPHTATGRAAIPSRLPQT